MTDEDRLKDLLRSSLPLTGSSEPSRDLWPLVKDHNRMRIEWSWIDINMGIAVIIVLLIFPNLLWLLAYHL